MRNVIACALVGSASALVSVVARAEPSAPADADALFRHGVELMKADACGEAVPEFLRSEKLEPNSATLINLATCYARLGRKATAFKTYRQAADTARSEKSDELRERALQAMAVLGPTLTKLQIVTPAHSAPLVIRVNGEPLQDYDGLPIPLDPGESIIEAAAPGREPWRRSITADDLGATLVIQVPELPPVPTAAPPERAPRPLAPSGVDWRVPAAAIAGAGVAALLVGSAFGVSAQRSYDDSLEHCSGTRCTPRGGELRDSARNKALVSTWFVGLGAVATATGVVLWLVNPRGAGGTTSLRQGTGVGLHITGNALVLEVRR